MSDVKMLKILSLVVVAFAAGLAGGFVGVRFLGGSPADVVMERSYVEESEIIDVVSAVDPLVVSIVVGLSDDFDVSTSVGTGFIVSADGLVLTNKHVIAGNSAVYKVVFSDGVEYEAEFLSEDPFDDIAALRIVGGGSFVPVRFGDSDVLRVGQRVLAIGNALAVYGNSVTSGIVSATERQVVAYDEIGLSGENLSGLIQTDAAINLGNSGGPLLNLDGEVIGMNVAVAEFANGIGFAIPVNDLKPVLESLERHGRIIRPVLGVRFIMLSEAQAKDLEIGIDHGAVIISGGFADGAAVLSGGAADVAGLRESDVILEVDGLSIDDQHPLHKVIREYDHGDTIVLSYARGTEIRQTSIVLGSSEDL